MKTTIKFRKLPLISSILQTAKSKYSLDTKFEQPETLPTFESVKTEELNKENQHIFSLLTANIISLYLSVI